MSRFLATVFLAAALATSSLACADHDAYPRNVQHHRQLAKRQGPADEAAAATESPAQECVPYSYAPFAPFITSFPINWQIANLSQPNTVGDSVAKALFASIQPGIPNIPTKGLPNGNFTLFTPTYDPHDPDCWWSYSMCTKPKLPGLNPDIIQCNEPETWGLTYDDGPNCSHNALYDFLQSQNQKASMYFIGSNVENWPMEAQRALTDGHEIAVHTWSHNYMTALSNEQAFAELYYTKKIIKDIIGVTPRYWRAPYGDVDDRIRYIGKQLDMELILWNEDTDDWDYVNVGIPQVDTNYQNIILKGTNGTYANTGNIVLSHELNNFTMSESIKYFPQIQAAYKHIVPAGVCNNITEPYVESGNVYPNFQQYIAGTHSISLMAPTASPGAGIVLLTAAGSNTASVPTNTGSPSGSVKSSSTGSSTTSKQTGAGCKSVSVGGAGVSLIAALIAVVALW